MESHLFCGKKNEKFIKNIVRRINREIRIIVENRENITRIEYSMLLDSNFYRQIMVIFYYFIKRILFFSKHSNLI